MTFAYQFPVDFGLAADVTPNQAHITPAPVLGATSKLEGKGGTVPHAAQIVSLWVMY